MKLTFQTYLLVSLVSLVHVVGLAMLLSTKKGDAPTRPVSSEFIDEEEFAWMGPSEVEAPEFGSPPEDEIGAIRSGIDNLLIGENESDEVEPAPGPAASFAPPADPVALRRGRDETYDSVASSRRPEEGGTDEGAAKATEAPAVLTPLRELRPLEPSAVN